MSTKQLRLGIVVLALIAVAVTASIVIPGTDVGRVQPTTTVAPTPPPVARTTPLPTPDGEATPAAPARRPGTGARTQPAPPPPPPPPATPQITSQEDAEKIRQDADRIREESGGGSS